jgi:hypothetical protein
MLLWHNLWQNLPVVGFWQCCLPVLFNSNRICDITHCVRTSCHHCYFFPEIKASCPVLIEWDSIIYSSGLKCILHTITDLQCPKQGRQQSERISAHSLSIRSFETPASTPSKMSIGWPSLLKSSSGMSPAAVLIYIYDQSCFWSNADCMCA